MSDLETEIDERPGKSATAFRTISEVADELELPQHVLRFWESKFPQVKPLKRGGGRRYYRPEDVVTLREIKALLHSEGYTIKGAQKLLRQKRGQSQPSEPLPAKSVAVQGAPKAATAGQRTLNIARLRDELKELRAQLDDLLQDES